MGLPEPRHPRRRGRQGGDRGAAAGGRAAVRQLLLPGDQRLRAEPERRQAVDGISSTATRASSASSEGYAHPIRFNALVAAGKVPADLLAKLPPPEAYKNVKFADAGADRQGEEGAGRYVAEGREARLMQTRHHVAGRAPAARVAPRRRGDRGGWCCRAVHRRVFASRLFMLAPTVMLAIQSVIGDDGLTLQYLDALRANTISRRLRELDRAVGRVGGGRRGRRRADRLFRAQAGRAARCARR